jgi:hypothetical protein
MQIIDHPETASSSTRSKFRPGPRATWSPIKRFWMFLLLWYVGSNVVAGLIQVFGATEGERLLHSSFVPAVFVAGYLLCGFVTFKWVKSGRPVSAFLGTDSPEELGNPNPQAFRVSARSE